MELSIGFSPCPNDTFIFDALIHHKIDTEGLVFKVHFEDVETLNQKALRGELDITKLSFHAFAHVLEHYALLDAGSALGFGVGPLLISSEPFSENRLFENNCNLKVGIPGKLTTANFLLSLAYPHLRDKVELNFSEIEGQVLSGDIDLGVIIHENRFTYQERGLHKVTDLGTFWEEQTGLPIPLGGIVINRKIDLSVQQKVNRILRKSVEFAFSNPKSGLEFIAHHAQEMDETVMYKHIELYVNQFSVNLGSEGRLAIDTLFKKARALKLVPQSSQNVYVSA